MNTDVVRQKLIAHLEERALAYDLDIVDVELKGGAKAPLVCVYLDHVAPSESSITLNEITEANPWIGDAIEELAIFSGPYTLEVSSPGLERPLRRESDFMRFMGEKVRVRLGGYEGRRNYTGLITSVQEGMLSLDVDGEIVELPLARIAKASLVPNFNDL